MWGKGRRFMKGLGWGNGLGEPEETGQRKKKPHMNGGGEISTAGWER